MRRRGLYALGLAAAVAAVVLGSGHLRSATPTVKPTGWFAARVTYDPNPPVALRHVEVRIRLVARGRPVRARRLRVELFMTDMSMPLTRVAVRRTGRGVYRGRTVFVMGGPWAARIQVWTRTRRGTVEVPVTVDP